jgi:beta-glucosidase/6-phospho-beta-glucosidase/beta-galactosidase
MATGCKACLKKKGFWCPSSDKCLDKDWDGFNHCYNDRCEETHTDVVKKKKRYTAKKKVVKVVTPVKDWYWEVVHSGVKDSIDYMPDPKQAITQGVPAIFEPGK